MSKVLVANRGEIALRIIRSAQELGWSTVALYTEGDSSHAAFADEAVKLGDASNYTDVKNIVEIAKRTQCTHVHPGYGFLSESPALCHALSIPTSNSFQGPTVTFVGPSVSTLEIASDKMQSRDLARSLNISITPGKAIYKSTDVLSFAQEVGYPVIVKALDGGGGRGIRIVENKDGVEEAFKRCLGESASRHLFIEKALTETSWKHIEVQIVGDGLGNIIHLWERECSVQRRFQKIVEMAPSTLSRETVEPLLKASIKMAHHLEYRGLGTFEFLVNSLTRQWVFIEINPRIQVEHTVTEEITSIDLVRAQLLLSLPNATLTSIFPNGTPPLRGHSIQLRLTAEDPSRAFMLSTGHIHSTDLAWPTGRGVRVDTWLSIPPGSTQSVWNIGSDFDSLLAKIIVYGANMDEATQKAQRALSEVRLSAEAQDSVKTNLELLMGVVYHQAWVEGAIYTTWLEHNLDGVFSLGKELMKSKGRSKVPELSQEETSITKNFSPSSSRNIILQPGTLFHLALSPGDGASGTSQTTNHILTVTSIAHNAFPEHLSGSLLSTISPGPLRFSLTQSSSAQVSSSSFELADPNDPGHIAAPLTGKIVELHPAFEHIEENTGTKCEVKKGETLVVLSAMKMESVVVAPRNGTVQRKGKGVEIGAIISEGLLVCVLGDVEHNFISRL